MCRESGAGLQEGAIKQQANPVNECTHYLLGER